MPHDTEKKYSNEPIDDFFKVKPSLKNSEEPAVKRLLAFQLVEAMKSQGITKVEMARRLKTSRSQLDRLLDPEHDGVTLTVLARAAQVVGRELRLELAHPSEDIPTPKAPRQ